MKVSMTFQKTPQSQKNKIQQEIHHLSNKGNELIKLKAEFSSTVKQRNQQIRINESPTKSFLNDSFNMRIGGDTVKAGVLSFSNSKANHK